MVFLYCYCKNYGTKIHLFLELYAPNVYLFFLLQQATDKAILCVWKHKKICAIEKNVLPLQPSSD